MPSFVLVCRRQIWILRSKRSELKQPNEAWKTGIGLRRLESIGATFANSTNLNKTNNTPLSDPKKYRKLYHPVQTNLTQILLDRHCDAEQHKREKNVEEFLQNKRKKKRKKKSERIRLFFFSILHLFRLLKSTFFAYKTSKKRRKDWNKGEEIESQTLKHNGKVRVAMCAEP